MSNRYQHIFFFVLLAAALLFMYLIVRPYIAAIFIAFVCYVVFKSYHDRLEKRLNNKSLSALAGVLSVMLLIVLPLCVVAVLVFYEARDLYTNLSATEASGGILSQVMSRVESQIHSIAPAVTIDLQSYVRGALNWLISHTGTIFSGFLKFFITLVIMLFALFYLFKDGKSLRAYFIKWSPFDEVDDANILSRLELTINSVVRGSLIVAIIQGLLTTIGLTIFGASQPVLWGVVAAFASLVPGVGTAIVSIPAIIYFVLSGNIFGAVGYGIWAIIAIGSIDNLLSPHLIERRVNIHPFLILLSVLGGLVFFGPIGFLAGPIVLAFTVELIKMYPRFSNQAQ